MQRIQQTVARELIFKGVGLHTGKHTKMHILPAPPNHGIVFERTDLKPSLPILAHHGSVISTTLATSLGIETIPGMRVDTVEHLLSAFFAMGITNAKVKISGPEVPILDGSALPYINALIDEGILPQHFTQPLIRILKPIKVYKDGTICELLPRDNFRITTSVDFPHPLIGLQTFALDITAESFQNEVCRARTFGFQSDLEKLMARNLALGASLENVLAFSQDEILNPEGARFPDECVRHKLLDAIGDLSLLGCWIEGEMVSFRGGHSIHLTLMKSLDLHPNHWEIVPASALETHTTRTAKSNVVSLCFTQH